MLVRARWVLPITSPPIRDGWVTVENGRVAAVGSGAAPESERGTRAVDRSPVDLGSRAIMPGVVNAHTHLELSWMRDVVPAADRMSEWIATLMAARRDAHRDDPLAIGGAVADLRRFGTSVVGDISNTFASVPSLAASPLAACVFYEMLGFADDSPAARVAGKRDMARAIARDRVRISLVPHSPYSVSPALFRELATLANQDESRISVHVGESRDEIEFLRDATGTFRELLERLNLWTGEWHAPGTGAAEYLDRFGLINSRTLVVHAVQLRDDELKLVADRSATIVTCPRSNAWVGAGAPPVSRFYGSGAKVAVGTDSLASSPDLNVFAELRELRRLAPDVPASRLLHSATRAGAEALGFDEYGSIEPGRAAGLIAVDVPDGTTDVEQYLCGGITAEKIRWIG
jgi:cytosine/adenosine deaminase-related metal-dependent hydrolase